MQNLFLPHHSVAPIVLPTTSAISKPVQPPGRDSFSEKLQRVLQEHLFDPKLDVSMLCQLLDISRTPLHHKIKKLTGRSTTRYINYLRLEAAARLLENSSLTAAEIAYHVGFENPSYFSKRFKLQFGSSPKQYKAQLVYQQFS